MSKTKNEILMKKAKEEIDNVVKDNSVDLAETIANVIEIIVYAEYWLDTLRSQ